MIQQFHSWVYIFFKNENTNLKRYMHSSVYSIINYSCQDMELTFTVAKIWN